MSKGTARAIVAGCAILGCAAVGLGALLVRARPEAPPRAAPGQFGLAEDYFPFHPYDGSWTFVRIHTAGGYGFNPGWHHDYPDADRNFSRILREFTTVNARIVESGGNVLAIEDPRLFRFPIAYVSEPDEWRATPGEAEALRRYLLKGGFVIFDDFFDFEMQNLVVQMSHVLPELKFLPLDGTERIWNTFFTIDPLKVDLEGPRKHGTPRFFGLYENNDKNGRMLAVAGAGADIGDLWEWSDRGLFPVDPTNEAYQIGINYTIYALTH